MATVYVLPGARPAMLVTDTVGIWWATCAVCTTGCWEVEVVTGAATV